MCELVVFYENLYVNTLYRMVSLSVTGIVSIIGIVAIIYIIIGKKSRNK